MFDATTAGLFYAAQGAQARAEAVRDSLGSGTLTATVTNGETEHFAGTFAGPMVAGSDGSLSIDTDLSGDVLVTGTPNAATWKCRISNASGRYVEGTFGPGGRFTWSEAGMFAGQGARLNVLIGPAPVPPPAWRAGQAVNEWREIAGSSMSLCPPTVDPGRNSGGVQAKMNAWCGLSIDTRTSTVWSVANGGHDDYHGNEVNRIALEVDSPAWIEVYRSSAGFTLPNSLARYSDGAPASTHSYYSQQFIESRNMAMRFGLASTSDAGGRTGAIDGWDATTAVGNDGWSDPGDFAEWPDFSWDLPVVKDPRTEDVYCFRVNYSVYKWANATGAVSTINDGFPPAAMGKAATAFDPVRSRIFLANGTGAWTFDPATGKFTGQALTGTDISAVTQDWNGMIYEPEIDAFIVLHIADTNDVEIYRIDAGTFATTLLSTTGGVVPGGTGSARSPYTRFLYVPNLGGCIWFPLYAENGWFLRTH